MDRRARACCLRWGGCWAGCGFTHCSSCLRPPPAATAAHAAPTSLPTYSSHAVVAAAPGAANAPSALPPQQIPDITLEQLDALIPLIQEQVDRLDPAKSGSSSQAPISQHLAANMLVKWEDNKQICTSFIDSLPKEITDEVAGNGRSLLMPLLTDALGGMGTVHWLGIGFRFISWSLGNISDAIQNRDDCIGILRKSLRLLLNTKQIWQDTHRDDATINEDLRDSVEKAFYCAIFCTSNLIESWILRFLKAASVKEAIAKLDKELEEAKLQNVDFGVSHLLHSEAAKVERQITFHNSPPHTEGEREVIDDAVTFLNANSDYGIKAVLLHGMGGIGKSTLGLQIFTKFQEGKYYKACRVEVPFETREVDLCDIQRQILEKVCQHAAPKFSNLTDGKVHMQKELKQMNRPIFLYVDNVLEQRNLSQLLPKASFFPEGSKLLITSRGTHIEGSIFELGIRGDHSYKAIEVRKLQEPQAQQLLWKQLESAEGEHRKMSAKIASLEERVLALCDGLPLALVVVGKYIASETGGLVGNVEVWRHVVEAMQKAMALHGEKNDELYYRIQFSIQDLDALVKGAFLDAAFFLNVSRFSQISWEGLEWLVGPQNLKVLRQRALVRKGERRHAVEMHDVLKAQLGRRMVEADKDERRITGMDQFNKLQQSDLERVIALTNVTSVDALCLKQMPNLRLLQDVHVTGECEEIQLSKLRVADGLRCSRDRVFDWSRCESLKQVCWGVDRVFSWSKWGVHSEVYYEEAPNATNLEVLKHSKELEALALRGWSELKDVEVVETFTFLKKLRLSDCPEIESLPQGISRLTSLEELRLSRCTKLKGLHLGISRLIRLEVLDLSFCESLQSIPEGIANLTAVTKLDLSFCGSLQSIPEGIGNLTAVTALDLSFCGSLQSIPEGIGNLTAVTSLDLSFCGSLQSIPEGIGNLTAVTGLHLSRCESLQSIPEGIGNLTAVTGLDLRGCKNLQSIPEGIGNLTAVTGLDLSGCESLQSIPEGIGNLTAVTSLDLSFCGSLQSIPEGIGNLTAVTRLDLSGCESLQSIPEGIEKLTAVTDLTLDYCESLESILENCTSLMSGLTSLSIGRCARFEYLPAGVTKLTGLKRLHLGGCAGLRSLTGVSGLTGLTSLQVERCRRLPALPEDIASLTRLSELSLDECTALQLTLDGLSHLTGLTNLGLSWCTSLKELNLTSSLQKQSVPNESMPHLTGLVHLDVSCCKSLWSIEAVTALTALETLRLHYCSALQSLPEGLTRLASLSSILLIGCKSLTSIPEHLMLTKPLFDVVPESLNLSGCESLKSLPHSIGRFAFLKSLDLTGCTSLESLPEAVTSLSNLTRLRLLGCRSLQCLPRGLSNSLSRLSELELGECAKLDTPLFLKEVSCSMGKLTVLKLSKCEDLQFLTEGMTRNLSSLQEISLSGCKHFQSLRQAGVANWRGLRKLDLSGCHSLQSLPEELTTMTAISKLYLSGCAGLQSLPQGIFTSLAALEDLRLGGCRGLQLEESQDITLSRLAGLKRLDLSECDQLIFLLSQQGSVAAFKRCLESLNLSGCRSLHCLPEGVAALEKLQWLELSGCESLQSLSHFPMGSTKYLEALNLGGCRGLVDDQPSVWGIIVSLTRLRRLNLSGWQSMQALPDQIASLTSLYHLNLSECSSLRSLPPAITKLVELRWLDLSGCTSFEPLPEQLAFWISGIDLT